MKKFFGLSILAVLAVTGCSTYSPKTTQFEGHSYTMSKEQYAEWIKPASAPELTVTQRKPSSEIISRPVYVWEADSLRIPMSMNSQYNQTHNIIWTHYSMYTTGEWVPVRVQKYVTIGWREVSNPIRVCSGDIVEGSGKSYLWNNFYGAKKEQKPKALAEAIVGIGESSAKKLVEGGYFHRKPRSWEAFSAEIRSARNSGVIDQTAEHATLYKYRNENMENLGYDINVATTCTIINDSYHEPIQDLRWVTENQYQEVPHKDQIARESRTYHVSVTGPRLQSFESEVLVINLHRHDNNFSFSYDGNTYTNYSPSMTGSRITLTGTSRKFVPLPTDVFTTVGGVEASNGQGVFRVGLNKNYIPKVGAGQGSLMITMKVINCKRGTFNKNSCALGAKKTEVVRTSQAVPASGIVSYSFPRDPSKFTYVEYYVNAAGSPWYTNNIVKGRNSPGF